MLVVDCVTVWRLRQQKRVLARCGTMAAAGVFATVVGGVLGGMYENAFGVARLWSYGVFLHGPLILVAATILWRKRLWLAVGTASVAAGLVLVATDAFVIEPNWLEVTHYTVTSPKIRRPLRIVVVADFQADQIGEYEREVLERVAEEKPNLVLFAGDYLQAPWEELSELRQSFRALLRETNISKHAAAFAVEGNIDATGWEEAFAGTGVIAVADHCSFELPDFDVTCLPVRDSRNRMLAVNRRRPERLHIVVGHIPNFALGKIDADLLVAGHTHAGQARLPGVGPVVVNCGVPRAWASGLSHLSGDRTLVVSRGVGMERGYAPRLRFLCRPELAVIDVTPEKSEAGNARD